MRIKSDKWRLWQSGETLKKITEIKPLLASWERKDDPAQIRLKAYLDDVADRLGPLPPEGLFLYLDVDVEDRRRLLRHHDLENYLTPLVQHLGHQRFTYVPLKGYILPSLNFLKNVLLVSHFGYLPLNPFIKSQEQTSFDPNMYSIPMVKIDIRIFQK